MARSTGSITWASVFAVLAVLASSGATFAQENGTETGIEPGGRGAAIHVGSCASTGDVVEPLSPTTASFPVDGEPGPAGELVGSSDALPVVGSVTSVPVALADLVADGHSIVVRTDPAADTPVVACGDIGGRLIAGERLAVALGPVGERRESGFAWLSDAGDGNTSVSLYLVVPIEPVGPEGAKTVHFSGLEITLDEVEWDADSGTITITSLYMNPASGSQSTASLFLNGRPSLLVSEEAIPLEFVEQVEIPGRSTVRAALTASGLPAGTSPEDVTLVYGAPAQHQARLPLVPGEAGISRPPTGVKIPKKQRRAKLKGFADIRIEEARLEAAGCGGRLDGLALTPGPADELAMVVTVTAKGRAPRGGILEAFLRAPDGTSSTANPGVTGLWRGDTLRSRTFCFVAPAPGNGQYSLRFEGGDRQVSVRLVAPEVDGS